MLVYDIREATTTGAKRLTGAVCMGLASLGEKAIRDGASPVVSLSCC